MFWRQTPRLLSLAFEAKRRAAKTAHVQRAWLAWHAALLPRMDRPNFDKLAGIKPIVDQAPMSVDQMQANFDRYFR